MEKRTLPTVTLDQIFQTLMEKKACWASNGPIALAKKLEALAAGCTGPLNLRALSKLAECHLITRAEGEWLLTRTDICPKDFVAMSDTLGTPAFAARLDEWENPKPKEPTARDLKPGDYFTWGGKSYLCIGDQGARYHVAGIKLETDYVPAYSFSEKRATSFDPNAIITLEKKA